jgi:hypothetical protein
MVAPTVNSSRHQVDDLGTNESTGVENSARARSAVVEARVFAAVENLKARPVEGFSERELAEVSRVMQAAVALKMGLSSKGDTAPAPASDKDIADMINRDPARERVLAYISKAAAATTMSSPGAVLSTRLFQDASVAEGVHASFIVSEAFRGLRQAPKRSE